MKETVDISKSRFEELKNNPVFFLKYFENIQYDNQGKMNDYSTWRSTDRDLNISFEAGDFADRTLGYTLCIVDSATDNEIVTSDVVQISIHSASPNNVNDWIYIINSFIIRSQNREDKYAFMELLWALDKLQWNTRTLTSAFSKYPPQTIPFLITNIQKFGRVLSYHKQEALKEVCAAHNGQYNIYLPDIITQAYDCIPSETNSLLHLKKKDFKSLNLFSIIDTIFEQHNFANVAESITTSNFILTVHAWFLNEIPLKDYNILLTIFPTLSEEFRLRLVKRYFHDLRKKHISLDISFLQALTENKYEDFIRYRYCIEEPAEPIVLTVPLLIDTLTTLYSSKGHSFQTFDGVLDFAMSHCDTAHPAVDFKLDRFIPTCNRGAVYNVESFKGFIDYVLIRKLNENMMTTEHFRSTFICLMDKYARRQTYAACNYGDGSKIPDETFNHCSLLRKTKINGNKQTQEYWKLQCFHYQPYEDRWIIKHENLEYIKDLLKENSTQYSQEYNISLEMLSFEKLKEYILNLPKKFEVLNKDEFLVHSYNRNAINRNFDLYLIQEYSDILRMRIYPQEGALIGLKFDVFGFWKEIRGSLPEEVLRNSQNEQYKKAYAQFVSMESQEVRRRCIDSLKKELNSELLNNSYFELPYNRVLLSDTIKRFYHKESFNEKDQLFQHEFLTQSHIKSNFVQYCAPQLSIEKNPAISLPYFWCRGKECFHNNLGTQTLEEESHWINYSLFHMAEIMGFPMLHKTEGGYEPEQSVWQFIAITNKVMQKFRRLKCRSCGHMMFTDK